MKIGMRSLHFFILLFAASSLLFHPPSDFEAFAASPTDISATDAETDGVNDFTELDDAIAVATFTIGSSTYAIVTSTTDNGVQIIDITNPNNISATDAETDGENGFTELEGALGVATFVIGSSTYAIVVSGSDDGVQIIDISDPTDISATDAATDDAGGFTELSGAQDVATFMIDSSTYAIVASDDDDGVQIIDISDPENISATDAETDGENGFTEIISATAVDTFTIGSSTYAIVANYYGDGVQIIDISDPENISATDAETDGVNDFTELDDASGVATFTIGSSTYAIVASDDDDGVQIIDITNPNNISATDAETDGVNDFTGLNGASGVATFTIGSSTYAIVASYHYNGVQIIDLNTVSPTVTITSSSGSTGDTVTSTTLSYTATFSASTSNFVVGDITVTGTANDGSPEASNFAGSGTTYTFDVAQGSSDGTVLVSVAAGAATDSAETENTVSNTYTLTIDSTASTVTITSSSGSTDDTVTSTTLSYTATFSESTSNFVVGDITVTGTANGGSPEASNFAGSGTTYTFDVVNGSSDGTVSVSVAAGAATDAAGNDNTVSNTYTFTIDTSVAASTGGTCSRHVILGNCGTIAINNDVYSIIRTWTDVPTTEVLVGQPVTVTLSTPNNPTYTKIHFASVHIEVFSVPLNYDQSAHVDYSIMNNQVTYVSQSQLFQVAGATHRISQDPDVKNLEMFEVVFTMIFAKPMETSHVVVETKNKFGIPETLYLMSALKVNENLPQALTLEEKSKFSIVDTEPEMDPEPEMEMDPEPEMEMDPEPEPTKKEKSKRQRR